MGAIYCAACNALGMDRAKETIAIRTSSRVRELSDLLSLFPSCRVTLASRFLQLFQGFGMFACCIHTVYKLSQQFTAPPSRTFVIST